MAAFLDTCRFNPTLGGTTDWTYSSAVAGYNSPALAGVVNARVYKYRAEDSTNTQWEMGEGSYNTSTGVLTRTTVLFNSSGTGTASGQSGAGTKITFSTVPQVAIVALKEDLLSIEEANTFTATQQSQGRVNLGILGNNRIINPSGQINQNGSGTAADVTYWFDQWVHLNEANPVTPSQLTGVFAPEDGTPFMMRTTQSNASAQRFGIIQPIENANCYDLRGQLVTLSARVRMSVSTTLNYAIICHSGTFDAPILDVVNSWSSTTFTIGNFFINTGGNTTIVAMGSTALTANTFATVSVSGTAPALSNLLVFFWTNSQQAQNVTLDVGKVLLEQGAVASRYEPRPYVVENMLCQRYLSVIAPGALNAEFVMGAMSSAIQGYYPVRLPVQMLASPTCSVSAASDWNNNPFVSPATLQPGTSAQFAGQSPFGFRFGLTSASTSAPSPFGQVSILDAVNTSAKIIAKAQM